ncbi:MAG: hypothetical protein ACK5OB_13580 [Pirellula sp.]
MEINYELPYEKNMNPKLASLFVFLCTLATTAADGRAQKTDPIKVTPETYIRAETDRQFGEIVKMAGASIASITSGAPRRSTSRTSYG